MTLDKHMLFGEWLGFGEGMTETQSCDQKRITARSARPVDLVLHSGHF